MTLSPEWKTLPAEIINKIQEDQFSFPVKIKKIAERLDLIVKAATLTGGISGEIKCESGIYVIRVNRHDIKERQRFTVAHEIAHFLLHKDLIGDGISDDTLYRSKLSDVMEVQANRLAADLIMPWHLIEASLKKFSHLKPEAKYEAIAEEAEVSTTALKIRLGKL